MSLDALLSKLKKLDPETWLTYKSGMYISNPARSAMLSIGQDTESDRYVAPSFMRPKDRDKWLQGVIQDAILGQASRGALYRQWIYSNTGKTSKTGRSYSSAVEIYSLGPRGGIEDLVRKIYASSGSTQAGALLAAYVKALEAEAEAEATG